MRVLTSSELIDEISDVLSEVDGDFLEGIANQVLSEDVESEDDDKFIVS